MWLAAVGFGIQKGSMAGTCWMNKPQEKRELVCSFYAQLEFCKRRKDAKFLVRVRLDWKFLLVHCAANGKHLLRHMCLCRMRAPCRLGEKIAKIGKICYDRCSAVGMGFNDKEKTSSVEKAENGCRISVGIEDPMTGKESVRLAMDILYEDGKNYLW